MRSTIFLVAATWLVAACGTGSERGREPAAEPVVRSEVQTTTIVGLYESGRGPQRSELCIVDGAAGRSRFGLVVRTPNGGTCSGAGAATREGATMRLEMAGNQSCTIAAVLDGGRTIFPAALPAGCAYYCAPAASMAGAVLVKTGGTEEDALRARDLVGAPLCADL